jgi:hypothetical protein
LLLLNAVVVITATIIRWSYLEIRRTTVEGWKLWIANNPEFILSVSTLAVRFLVRAVRWLRREKGKRPAAAKHDPISENDA